MNNNRQDIYVNLKCNNLLFSNLSYGEMYNTTNAKIYSGYKM